MIFWSPSVQRRFYVKTIQFAVLDYIVWNTERVRYVVIPYIIFRKSTLWSDEPVILEYLYFSTSE